MKETWKDIPSTGNRYSASNMGRVKSNYRLSDRGDYYVKEHILKQHINNSGRAYVVMSIMGRRKHGFVHRLVAEAFIPNPENKPQINHIDGNPLNNKLENLEWATATEQELHKLYQLGHINGSLLSAPRPVRCKETGAVYPSMGHASRITGVPLHIIFTRVRKGIADNDGNHWEYVVK